MLAPGYGGSAEQPIVRAMAERLRRVGITPKPIAFSRARPSGDFGPELDDLRRARDSLTGPTDLTRGGAEPIGFVGRSFGGRICTRLAALEPRSVAALVLLGHPIAPRNRPRPDDEAALAQVRCPTLIVQGERDALGPLDVLRRIAAQNDHIEIFVLPGVGHQFGARQNEGLDRATAWLRERL